jgi:uncharacterized protein YcbK (DUF882 family)
MNPTVQAQARAISPARRDFLRLGAGAAAVAGGAAALGALGMRLASADSAGGGAIGSLAPATFTPAAPPVVTSSTAWPAFADVRRAFIHNLHTGDKLDAVYFEGGRYVPGALAEAMRVMRDWRNGSEHVMDPRLFDLLHGLGAKLGSRQPFQLISGYRSPQTNAMLHAESGQVASHSQHMLGKASDIRVEGVPLARLHEAALSLKAGGVGYYPSSNFVHVDVARVRHWSGS